MSLSSTSTMRRHSDAELASLAWRFGDVLRAGDGAAAEALVDEALRLGIAPEAIQSLVIAPAMTRIGELWEQGLIGVADEHLATSLSHRALVRLFQFMTSDRPRPASRERVLLAAVQGQQHVLGLQMVADVLEVAGFDVLNLGPDVPTEGLRAFVAEHRPAVAGLAWGMATDIAALADAVAAIHDVDPSTPIMLGGRAVPAALVAAGYPWVTDSMSVLATVEGLLARPPVRVPPVADVLCAHVAGRSPAAPRGPETDEVAARLAQAADEAIDLARMHVRRAESFRELAFRDALTDLPNRRAFDDRLHGSAGGSLLVLDVDDFKSVNDRHGHAAGDEALRAVAAALTASIRPTDFAARLGGDEFAVLLPGTTEADALDAAERIRLAVRHADGPPFTVSIGASPLTADPRGCMLSADAALYAAKLNGRDQVGSSARPAARR